jgi:hypothetical protein
MIQRNSREIPTNLPTMIDVFTLKYSILLLTEMVPQEKENKYKKVI